MPSVNETSVHELDSQIAAKQKQLDDFRRDNMHFIIEHNKLVGELCNLVSQRSQVLKKMKDDQ